MSTDSKSIKEKQLPAHSVSIEFTVALRGFPATARLLFLWRQRKIQAYWQ